MSWKCNSEIYNDLKVYCHLFDGEGFEMNKWIRLMVQASSFKRLDSLSALTVKNLSRASSNHLES